jgi:flagellar capping protein FliD
VNVGNSGNPEYHLSLQANKLGNLAIDLSEGTVDAQGNVTPGTPLMDPLVTGSLATYSVNGINKTISSDSTTITLAPGVSVKMLQTNVGSPATITVGQNATAIQTALQSLAATYNAAVDQVNASYGSNANALQGDAILVGAKSALRAISSYQGSNGQGVSYLGLTLDSLGHLTFDASKFQNAVDGGVTSLSTYLGDLSSGFAYAANSAVDSLMAPGSGDLKAEEDQVKKTLSSLNTKISDEVDRINTFQQNLVLQLSLSDAAIYQLESRASFFEGLFNYNNKQNN